MAFKICFLIRVISKINNKGNWAHLAELNKSRTRSWGLYNIYILYYLWKHFKDVCFALSIKIMLYCYPFHFKPYGEEYKHEKKIMFFLKIPKPKKQENPLTLVI